MAEKLCVFCTHWIFNGGEIGYSELTPGSNGRMNCGKQHYGKHFYIEDIYSEDEFRKIILKATTCKDFTQVNG